MARSPRQQNCPNTSTDKSLTSRASSRVQPRLRAEQTAAKQHLGHVHVERESAKSAERLQVLKQLSGLLATTAAHHDSQRCTHHARFATAGMTWAPSAMCCFTFCVGSFHGKDADCPDLQVAKSVSGATGINHRDKLPGCNVSYHGGRADGSILLRKKRKKRIGKRKAKTSHQDLCKGSGCSFNSCTGQADPVGCLFARCWI